MTEPKLRLQEGLDKLKKLDPETYETIYQMGFNKCHWPNYLIQGVIQDAITARGWQWSVDWLPSRDEGRKCAGIIIDPEDEDEWIDIGEADAPAEAILLTYVAALEAKG